MQFERELRESTILGNHDTEHHVLNLFLVRAQYRVDRTFSHAAEQRPAIAVA